MANGISGFYGEFTSLIQLNFVEFDGVCITGDRSLDIAENVRDISKMVKRLRKLPCLNGFSIESPFNFWIGVGRDAGLEFDVGAFVDLTIAEFLDEVRNFAFLCHLEFGAGFHCPKLVFGFDTNFTSLKTIFASLGKIEIL